MRPSLMGLEDRNLLSTTTIVVNNPTDTPVAGQIDLRQAIGMANSNGGNETITFDSKVFKTPQTITLDPTLGQLELSDATGTETITGPKAGVTISGNNASRVVPGRQRCHRVDLGPDDQRGQDRRVWLGGGLLNDGGIAHAGGLHHQRQLVPRSTTKAPAVAAYTAWEGATTLTNCTVSGNWPSALDGCGLFRLERCNHAEFRLRRQRHFGHPGCSGWRERSRDQLAARPR